MRNKEPDLFSDKVCAHCGKDPGPKPTNKLLWNGFYDKDTKQLVCWNCHDIHYTRKNKTEFANLYSEFPVYAVGRI